MCSVTRPVSEVNPISSAQSEDTSFQSMLGGRKAFYLQPDYLETTKREFSQTERAPTTYTTNTEYPFVTLIKQIFSYIIFPIAIYNQVHAFAGRLALLPSSDPSRFPENYADKLRAKVPLEGEWKYKRLTIEVDGYKIDATIMGKPSTLNNGRWVLASNGNGEFYEEKLHDRQFKQILSEVNGNGIIFNYPGVAASSGIGHSQAMEKAYRAVLRFLEDKNQGIGAKEIIGYGHSIGGGVQAEALLSHTLQSDVKYVFVKSRTFTNLSDTAASLVKIPFVDFLVKMLGWNISTLESSKELQAPEIIMQTARVTDYEELRDSSKVIDDGVIKPSVSLTKALLDDPNAPKENKVFIGMPEKHNDGLVNPAFLATKIEQLLRV